MCKVKVAIMAALVLGCFSGLASGQTEVSGPPEVQRAPDSPWNAPAGQMAGDMPAEEAAEPALAQGLQGSRGERGPQGQRGQRGPAGASGRTIVRNTFVRDPASHSGHRGPYQEVKSWGVVAGGYVAGKLRENSEADRAYAKGLLDANRHTATAADQEGISPMPLAVPPAQHDWTWLLWLLLILAILAGLIALIRWLMSRPRSWLTNYARFWALRRFIGERSVRVGLIPGCRQAPEKAVKNRSAGETTWQTRESRAMPGDVLRYRLRVRNMAHAAIPADTVVVADAPDEGMEFVAGSGCASINTSQFSRCPLPDSMIQQLLEGRALRMSDIPGMRAELPANSSLYVWYDLRVATDEDESFAELDFVEPPAPAEERPAGAQPTETAQPAAGVGPAAEAAEEDVDEIVRLAGGQ